MKSVKLFIDESGAKGYSSNIESEPGELGVVSGILVPSSQVEKIENDLNKITSGYSVKGKLHITDIESENQRKLREEVFLCLELHEARWVYEAIYVEGFFQNEEFTKGIIRKLKENRRSGVKISDNENRNLLHTELFIGAFGKGVALATDMLGNKFNIDVVTDRVDDKLLKRFGIGARGLLNVGEYEEINPTGFDTKSGKVVRSTISTEVVCGKEGMGDFTGVTYTLSSETSSLTVAADVLVNSVYYHLKSKQKTSVGFSLNTQAAIKGHPLEGYVYGVSGPGPGQEICVSDVIYMYPGNS